MKKAGFLRTGQAKVMKSRQAVPLNIKDKDLTPCAMCVRRAGWCAMPSGPSVDRFNLAADYLKYPLSEVLNGLARL